MQNDKLLPCPFCGEKELIYRSQMRFTDSTPENMVHEDGTMKWSYIECGRCGCSTKAYCYEYQSTKKWNIRKPMEWIVESLEKELKLSDKEKERCAKENPMQFDSAKGYSTGIANALDIVRKGGVDNAIN